MNITAQIEKAVGPLLSPNGVFYEENGRLKYIEYGKQNDEIIMMLHGGGLSWWNYRDEAEILCDDYHVILPIIDGHADSGSQFESIELVADKLIEYINSNIIITYICQKMKLI